MPPTTLQPSVPIQSLLITGVTGFVGSHVAEAIAGRAPSLRALVRSHSRRSNLEPLGFQLVTGSLEDAESVQLAVEDVEVVVHMAAATRAHTERDFVRVNEQGTRTVVEAIRRAKKPPRRLVYMSSLAAAGPARQGLPLGAEDPPRPITMYGRTKLAGERICSELAGICDVVILRPPAVYGPRDRDMFEFFRLARWGVLPVPGGPQRMLQLIHVQDLARAVVLAATVDRVRGVYHIAESQAYGWEQVCRLMARAVGKRARIVRLPAATIAAAGAVSEAFSRVIGKASIFNRDKARELLAPGWLCETEAAERDLGFVAEFALEQGLTQTATWYRTHGWL